MVAVDEGVRNPRVTPDVDAAMLSPEYLADPYPIYAQLRREPPVAWSETLDGWVVARYDDVRSAMRDPRLSVQGRMPASESWAPFSTCPRSSGIQPSAST